MNTLPSYTLQALGDTAMIIDFGNRINRSLNEKMIFLYEHLVKHPLPGMTEVVPAYSSLAVYYDVPLLSLIEEKQTAFEVMSKQVREYLNSIHEFKPEQNKLIELPVCYDDEFGHDLGRMAEEKKISKEDIISLHLSLTYRVYMLGFLPGFAYMGIVDESIEVPRKPRPMPVVAGSVGIAGRQTGIYPFNSPGGWQIIGRTPVRIFEKEKADPVLFHPGDEVRFYSISKNEFENYKSGNS